MIIDVFLYLGSTYERDVKMNPKYILDPRNPRNILQKNTDNKLENFYNKFKNVAEYLNLELLMKAIKFDPF